MQTNLNEKQVRALFLAGLAILALFVAYRVARGLGDTAKGIFEGIGVSDTEEEKKAKQKTIDAIEKNKQEVLKTSKPTRTAAQWLFVANTIFDALKFSALSDDKAKAYSELARVLTDADMAILIQQFGLRQERSFGVPIGEPKTLPQFVSDNLDQEDIDDLNLLYARSKMKFKFS
jgi:hypothetical protein